PLANTARIRHPADLHARSLLTAPLLHRAAATAVALAAGLACLQPAAAWADAAPASVGVLAAMPAQIPVQVPVADLLGEQPLASLSSQTADAALIGLLQPAALAYPLAEPALQIDPWGWRYSESRGAWRMHTGVDFAAPTGTGVLAALPGRVVLAEELSGYGLTVVLDHGQGLSTLYAHLERIAVPLGAALEQGQELGSVGMTGRTSGPHLHFELRSRGAQVVAHNPVPYLPPLLPPPALTAARP
ncbi:MAG: M23 family metallopeptidase, partial [Prochlorococcaceae cyanobacterium]